MTTITPDTPVERLREWTKWTRTNPLWTPRVEDVEAVLAMLPAKLSPVCANHNPDRLTEEQVNVADGWRLLTEEERYHQSFNTSELIRGEIEGWRDGAWTIGNAFYEGSDSLMTYRTRHPPHYFLPQRKVKVPLTAEDLPAVCWIRSCNAVDALLVTEIDSESVRCGTNYISYNQLMNSGCEYSTDHRVWRPCSREIEQAAA